MSQARPNMPGDDPPLVWSTEFSVGDPQLDADHRTLFAIAAMLEDAPSPAPATLIVGVLDALSAYVIGHFEREEYHMAELGFPELDSHREHHTQLVQRLNAFRARYFADPKRLDAPELRRFLRQWLINHVLHEDMKYRWFEEGHYEPL